MTDDYGDSNHRMMRQLDEEDSGPKGALRCDGCGRRVPLQAYNLDASSESDDWVMYCAACRALAAIEDAESGD
jgi:hypothetical protein